MKGNKLGRPIIGSNVIELILNSELKKSNATNMELLSHTVRTVFPTLEPEQAQAFVHQVSVGQGREYTVKTTKERINIPKHMSVKVECHVQMPPPHGDAPLIFEPDVNPHWAEGLELCDTVVQLSKDNRPYITVSVQNPTAHDIVLTGRTVIGTVQIFRPCTPLPF